jgi:hypothetical protein
MISDFPIIQNVIDNEDHGSIFNFPDQTLIVHKSGFCQIVGNQKKLNPKLLLTLASDVLPSYFHLYNISSYHVKIILDQLPNWNFRIRKRTHGYFKATNYQSFQKQVEYELFDNINIDTNKLNRIPAEIYQPFYPDKNAFKTQSYFQSVFDQKGSFASVCYAAAVGNGIAEVDVYTDHLHRGKGIGKFVVNSFIPLLIQNKIDIHWDCFFDNFSSKLLAKHCGFDLNNDYWMLSIFKMKNDI